ncbi:serine/threonine-protein kinase [Teredinibacter waterburyi]|uniref:serine/threonine-protein kinase n=1 Tax=Teredinibacter waterburyi TaxID=1500538 RepID=UPI00165EE5DB|nr:serine/threonine-protein kinase [Teredinibacter waterburyi]
MSNDDKTIIKPRVSHTNERPSADATIVKATDATRLAPSRALQSQVSEPGNGGDITIATAHTQVSNHQQAEPTAPTEIDQRQLASLPPQPGMVIKDRFILREQLGEGGMGVVFLATDRRKEEARDTDSSVAIKILGDGFQRHPKAFVTLQREARKTQSLAHPNIVTVYDFDRDGDRVFLTMEALQGEPLDKCLRSGRHLKMSDKEKWQWVQQMAEGLAYAHSKGFVHADLKPANVFVTRDNKVKILDFGIARAVNDEVPDSFDAGELGALTPRYASLEMLNHVAPAPSDDIYALGVIICEIFNNQHPYNDLEASDAYAQQLKPNLPRFRNLLLQRLLAATVALPRESRIANASHFLRRFHFATKAVRRIVYGSLAILVLLTVNFGYLSSIEMDDSPAFSTLPEGAQVIFRDLIDEGDRALRFNDLQGAVLYYDKAFQIHARNKDMETAIAAIVAQVAQATKGLTADAEKAFWREQIKQLQTYKAFTDNADLTEILQKL